MPIANEHARMLWISVFWVLLMKKVLSLICSVRKNFPSCHLQLELVLQISWRNH